MRRFHKQNQIEQNITEKLQQYEWIHGMYISNCIPANIF